MFILVGIIVVIYAILITKAILQERKLRRENDRWIRKWIRFEQ